MSLLAAKVQRRDLLVPATRQRLIPAGVDLAAATEATDGARDRLRGRWRIPDGGVAYLLVAHHPRLKGADVALAALRAAVDSGVDAYLVLAGARLDDWLLGEAGRHRCTDRLVMAGLVDPIADAFAASDVLLHPTRWDAFGSVVLEAMAAGLPVVTTEAAGVAEVIEDGRTGIVIGADPSPRQLTEAMRSLAGNAERSRIGTSAREEAARHPIDSTYQALEDVLCGPLPPHHAWQNDTRRRARSVRSVQRHDHPKVSIVMPVRDGEAHVAEAIESVLDQTFEDFDLHVVDDGSVDGTCGIVDGYAERDDRITLHRRDRAGIVAALNHGIEVSESVYVARMDADDVCKPERLARQITALDGNPNIGVLGTNYEVIGADGTPGAVSRLPISPFEIALTLTETNPIAHPTVMMRRSVLDALGGYREGFPLCEDYDLWLRASEVCDLANLEEPLLAYRRTGRDTRREQRFRSEVAVIEDHHLRQIRDERPSGRTHPAVVGVARRRLAYMIRHDLVTGEGVEALRATLLAVHLPGLSGRRRQATEPTSS